VNQVELNEIALREALRKSEPWHDTDDIFGYISMQMWRRKPEKRHHAIRVAKNAKVDWIRKERGKFGQKAGIRNTFDLSSASHLGVSDDHFEIELHGLFDDREHRVFELLREGYTQKLISEATDLSPYVVSKLVRTVKAKLWEHLND
jgi:DNA-binding NarL/FixJ family response regulator